MTEDDINAARWWLLRCRTQREQAAARFLRDLGFLAYSPQETRYRKPSRYVKGKGNRIRFDVAALPGYLFVGFVAGGPSWARVMMHRDKRPSLAIIPVVVDDRAVRVMNEDVARLVEIERTSWLAPPEHHARQHRKREYDVGDTVEVIDGPLSGQTASVLSIENGRARINFAMLGKPVEMDTEALAKVG